MPRFYETTLSITNLHNLSISTHVNRSRIYTNAFCIQKYNIYFIIQLIIYINMY